MPSRSRSGGSRATPEPTPRWCSKKVREGKGAFGFNAATEKYENLMQAGIIDPTNVVRVALQNAASVAGVLLTTEVAVTALPKKGGAIAGGRAGDDS